uniref:PsbP C-terminal domain-containing protein n=1 Tax=Chrysotila carterae TaxID=13221 RepID=A0A7S4BPW2_CHRCT|mmetsp:Transcript_55770/g.121444  ORF Transcript_55770/g.121444 Transcript_55770/m.121444 type:complete len:224 (-) Transcript_55770:575-1246(-)
MASVSALLLLSAPMHAALLLSSTPATTGQQAAASASQLGTSAIGRRNLMRQSVLAAAALVSLDVQSVSAEDTFSRMGGALEPFIDVQKGYKLYKPVAWNQFDADPGVYDVKFQDVIEPFEIVQVSSSPVTTATSVSALGDVSAVGVKFAKSRNAELISAKERDADGSLVYTFELKGEMYHEYLALAVNRGKLFRVSTVTSNKRWPKREELFKNIILSFVPKGF